MREQSNFQLLLSSLYDHLCDRAHTAAYDLLHSGMSQILVYCNRIDEKHYISTVRFRHFVLAPRSSSPSMFGRIVVAGWGLNDLTQF